MQRKAKVKPNMKHLELKEKQEYLAFNEQDLIIIDKVQDLPENSTYYTEHVLVIICTAGKMQVEYDGKCITIQEGDLFLGVPSSVLSDYMISPKFDCKLLAIKPSELMSSGELHTQVISSAFYVKTHPVVHLTETDSQDVFAYYNLICSRIRQAEHHYKNAEMRSLIKAFLLKVISIMDREMEMPETESTAHGEQLVEKFVWMVNEDCGRNRLVEYYANRLNITSKYLSTLVRSSLNRTPTEIIQVMTMKEIERRLRYTDDSIKQISHAMNFPNTSFFGKYFKQHSGMTPNNYRMKYHK